MKDKQELVEHIKRKTDARLKVVGEITRMTDLIEKKKKDHQEMIRREFSH